MLLSMAPRHHPWNITRTSFLKIVLIQKEVCTVSLGEETPFFGASLGKDLRRLLEIFNLFLDKGAYSNNSRIDP